MEKAAGKKKRKAFHTNFSKAELLNNISVEVAKELYAIEVEQHAGPIDANTGCCRDKNRSSQWRSRLRVANV
jgi:hypothetical protein